MTGDAFRRVFMTTDAVGGVWSYALELARGLARADIETTLAVLGPAPDEAQAAEARTVLGLAVIETHLPLDWDPAVDARHITDAGATLADLASDARARIVHLNSPILASHTSFSAPVVGVCHSCLATWWHAMKGDVPLPCDFAWRTALLRQGYQRCDVLIAPSDCFATMTASVHGLPAKPIVVHNGRDRRWITGLANDFHPDIFTAGRLWDEAKNAKALDAAASLLGTPIFAAGSTAAPNGQSQAFKHLRLIGQLSGEEIAACFARRPVFVSVAKYEPFGLSVLEAALAGCALVLSDIPTFRELWDGAACFVPAESEHAIARALRDLLERPDLRRALGIAAAERASRYSTESMTARMLTIYASVASLARASS